MFLTVVLLVIILALTKMQSSHPGLDPHDQLNFEKQQSEQRTELLAAKTPTLPALDCAAAKVTKQTVRTLYLVWVNHRPDLPTNTDRDDATTDLTTQIRACNANPTTIEEAAHHQGLDLEAAAAQSFLKAGR